MAAAQADERRMISAATKLKTSADGKGSSQQAAGTQQKGSFQQAAGTQKKGSSQQAAGAQQKEHKSNHNKTLSEERGRFVPPPPPTVPTLSGLGIQGMGPVILMGENIDYMSAADLRDLKEKTGRAIERSRRDLEDLISSADEKLQRANSFDKLYAEGVISRRELENSKHESNRATEDLSEAKQNLTLLEQKYARIEKRIAALNQAKKPARSGQSRKSKIN